MQEKEILMREITASEGKWLTPVVVNELEPVFAKTIYLGVSDKMENWKEVTNEEKEVIEVNASEKRREMVDEIRGK